MRGLACLLVVVLAGCAVAPVPERPAEEVWRERQGRLAELQAWVLTGQLALITEDEGWHGSLRWVQDGQGYEIRITAPLGQGSVVLRGDGRGVVMRSSREPRPVSAPDPEALLRRRLGWDVPLGGLRYWVRGLPDPSLGYSKRLDAYGRLERLGQAGWEVRFLGYTRVGRYELPDKIFMRSGELQVRMVVRDWQPEG
ncbi:MAG: outer membrane lipoprotein LolB [Gammaproteobacteria bacterium]|nr:outer membrane lipoprotein LolB [Gammaproteobacteria bacterium]NIR98646.1 outer membrane lipoprotein LolB [Gammaproteobacteria bacterium]NIT64363.1 outer membrane lipoprotein LolB [Gammaproteobacteria bacterium]NIV21295.1 outer membrane lipoprotein LolB [Gammaproteobacteria bacterium]NIY32943.1 outer membrane lipoprotein LolB [Gammaproteobacteria bacterium]